MKIAIASCINSKYKRQPVWANVASVKPDVLVLLGDNVYYDIPWANPVGQFPTHPSDLSDAEFLEHGHALYVRQLNQSGFKKLVQSPGLRTFAIWDDHDFLWNDAAGGSIAEVIHGGKVRASRALHWQFVQALNKQDVSSFPANVSDIRLNKPYESAPGYSYVKLGDSIVLHLTDGRSYRNSKTMFGAGQRDQMTDVMDSHPDAIHLVASGNVVQANQGDRWAAYREDFDWLLEMASDRRMLILSGDVHENRLPNAPLATGGKIPWVHEITSSGAAIGNKLTIINGPQQCNFGLVNIDLAANCIDMELFQGEKMEASHPMRKIDISSWAIRQG